MSTVNKLIKGLDAKYKLNTVLSPIAMIGEVIVEVIIPTIMASLINDGIKKGQLDVVTSKGFLMIGLSLLSLVFGVLGIIFSTNAAQGFAYNLRKRLFDKIQTFSFANIDKFSSASLITRLTTDVNMTQNVYRMLIHMCVRSPFMLIAGSIMAFKMNAKLALIFVVAVPVIAISILFISTQAHPRFEKMMHKFDDMNKVIQENLIGIRIVKAYVRGDFEEDKFCKAADEVRRAQVSAEKMIIIMMPIMQLVMYSSVIALMWFGGKQIVIGTMQEGDLVGFFTYITQVLSSLMMIGMVFVSLVMVKASNRRIIEVLDEVPDIDSPKKPKRLPTCLSLEEVDAFAVTRGPGLIGALHVGLQAAKTLAMLYKKPLKLKI